MKIIKLKLLFYYKLYQKIKIIGECVCQQEITLEDYNYLNIELYNLFGKKYRKNSRVVIYIYIMD